MTGRDVVMACHLAVLRALGHASNKSRATRRSNGRDIERETGVPKYLVHTMVRLAHNDAECDRLLTGAWDLLAVVVGDADAARIVNACDAYTRDLIMSQRPPRREQIAEVVDNAVSPASR